MTAAQEAMAESLRPLWRKIQDGPCRTVYADQLERGMAVKLCGEWYPVVRVDLDRMRIIVGSLDGHPGEWEYPYTDGERFVWTGCF